MSATPSSQEHVVIDGGGTWRVAASVPSTHRYDLSQLLAARGIGHQFAAPPLGEADGRGASGTILRLLVLDRDLAATRAVLAGFVPSERSQQEHGRGDRDAEVTRLLCASVIDSHLLGQSVLDFLSSKGTAVAPEIGVDVALVARVAAAMKTRMNLVTLAMFFIWLFCALLAVITPPIAAALFIVLTGSVYLADTFGRHSLLRLFRKDKFDRAEVEAHFPAQPEAEVQAGYPAPDQNLVVHRWFAPFVGAGQEMGGWSFTVDLSRARTDFMGQEQRPIAFREIELYDTTMAALRGLGLPDTTIADYAFVFGEDVRNDRTILPDIYGRPSQVLSPEEIRRYRETGDKRVRSYPWIRIHDWQSEIVISQFIRFHIHGKYLFVELSRYLLTPVGEAYRAIDREGPPTWRKIAAIVFGGAIVGPIIGSVAPLLLLARLSAALDRRKKRKLHRRAVDQNLRFNYGTANSLRQSVSGGLYTRYFQKQDATMYEKILQAEVYDTIVSFLDQHNVDTSELREQRIPLLNNGVIVNRGDVNAGALAVGTGASAKKSATLPGLVSQLRPRTVSQPTQKAPQGGQG